MKKHFHEPKKVNSAVQHDIKLELDVGFAGEYQGWRLGQYIYEEVDSPQGRLAINNYDFSHPDFYIGHRDTPWRRSGATKVTVGTPSINEGRASTG